MKKENKRLSSVDAVAAHFDSILKDLESGKSLKDSLEVRNLKHYGFKTLIKKNKVLAEAYQSARIKGPGIYSCMSVEKKEEYKAKIFEMMRLGSSLSRACRELGVDKSTMLAFFRSDEKRSKEYDDAREDLFDYWADETLDICDKPPDTIETVTEHATTVRIDPGSIQDKRVRIDTRKWLLAKLSRRFADKTTLVGDAENPLTMNVTQITRRIVRPGDIKRDESES